MLNEIMQKSERKKLASLPTVGAYLRSNPKTSSFPVPESRPKVVILDVGVAEQELPSTSLSSSELFTSLEQFNETLGNERFKLAQKKSQGNILSTQEENSLSRLNEIFRSLLKHKESDTSRFLSKFVREYGLDGE